MKNKKIVITGASGGLGERIAFRVAEAGGTPIIIARTEQKLEQIKRQIEEKFNINCSWYKADLTHNEEVRKTLREIISTHKTIHALISNAGVGRFSLVKDAYWKETERMFQLNVFALIQGIEEVLPHFIQHGEGHIVNIGSQAGKIATPKSTIYSATKHAVLGYTNALRLEIESSGIYVTSVNLGPMETSFFDTADPNGKYRESVRKYMLNPDTVAQKIVRSLFKKKREINMPLWMEIGSRIHHLFPSLVENLLRSQFDKK